MTKEDLEQLIIEVLSEIQKMAGQPPLEITRQTLPLRDLTDFDSLLALEATVELAHRLEWEIEEQNIFVFDKHGLSVGEVAERLTAEHKTKDGGE